MSIVLTPSHVPTLTRLTKILSTNKRDDFLVIYSDGTMVASAHGIMLGVGRPADEDTRQYLPAKDAKEALKYLRGGNTLGLDSEPPEPRYSGRIARFWEGVAWSRTLTVDNTLVVPARNTLPYDETEDKGKDHWRHIWFEPGFVSRITHAVLDKTTKRSSEHQQSGQGVGFSRSNLDALQGMTLRAGLDGDWFASDGEMVGLVRPLRVFEQLELGEVAA